MSAATLCPGSITTFWVLGMDVNFGARFSTMLRAWVLWNLGDQAPTSLAQHASLGAGRKWWSVWAGGGREPVRSRGRRGPGSQVTMEQALLTLQGAGRPWRGGACLLHSPSPPHPAPRPATEGLACLPLRPSAETESPEVLG